LKDLFRPRWQHSDPKVRAAAVLKLEDQQHLAKIAEVDRMVDIRELAIERITDQAVLKNLAGRAGDGYTIALCTEQINDSEFLASIARSAEQAWVGVLAASRLQDARILAAIARDAKHWSVRACAIDGLTDGALVAQIAQTDRDSRVCAAAVCRLTSLAGLEAQTLSSNAILDLLSRADVAAVDAAASIKLWTDLGIDLALTSLFDWRSNTSAAVDLLRGQALVAAAVARLTDPEVLARTARAHHAGCIREAAIQRLPDDQSLLDHVAMHDGAAFVRAAAINRSDSQFRLHWIVRHDSSSYVKANAVKRMEDRDYLVDAIFLASSSLEAVFEDALVENLMWRDGDELNSLLRAVLDKSRRELGNYTMGQSIMERILELFAAVDKTRAQERLHKVYVSRRKLCN
jgi:hypothetical protein